MIRLHNVVADIKGLHLFTIDDFTFEKGHIYLLTGENGTGKSSLLKSFIGQFPFITGDIEIDGKLIYQPQDPYIYQRTMKDNFKLFSLTEKQTDPLVDKLDLRESLTKQVDVLSGGQRQKLAFIRSYLLAEDILILDEPFAQMDALSRETCYELLNEWMNEKRIVIMVSHHKVDSGNYDREVRIEDKKIKDVG